MISDILFSVAGKKTRDEINELLESLLKSPQCPKDAKAWLDYTLQVSQKGSYPDKGYYEDQGIEPYRLTKSVAELKQWTEDELAEWRYEDLRGAILTAINTTDSEQDLKVKIASVIDSVEENTEEFQDYSEGLSDKEEFSKDGYRFNIAEVDNIMGSVRGGRVATIAAFTSEGKSTLAISSAFYNAKNGKFGVIFSVELPPSDVHKQLFSRWLYENKGVEISTNMMDDAGLPEDQRKLINDSVPEYNSWIKGKIYVVDEGLLNRERVRDYKALSRLYRKFESAGKVDSLDFVIYDHINQVDLMFEGEGNRFMRNLTSAGKTCINRKGNNPSSIVCVQCNREGRKRAGKRDGKYDLQALADINETERSSSYCLFLYTSDDMKLMQETKVTLLKNRSGALLSEPVSVNFNPAVFVVGETVETVSFLGDMSFLDDTTKDFADDDLSDF